MTSQPLQTMADTAASVEIDGYGLMLEDVARVAAGTSVKLSGRAIQQIEKSRSLVDQLLDSREVVYGITTGFGKFKDVYIPPEETIALQRNFLRSHAAGVGPDFDDQVVRAIILLRANALAKGFSGVRQVVVDQLLALLNTRIVPCIPEKGSVGASGDLAPLAHLALVLIGEGEARVDGETLSGQAALEKRSLTPLTLLAKEGLALTNGTQVMSAIGTLVVLEAERLSKLADLVGAMSLEAQLGSVKAFSPQIHAVRPHPGQLASASNLRTLLQDSALMECHADCKMVQDAYSLRCMPQVHGASRQAFAHARAVLEIEINSATDNPLVFEDSVLSGGNFHGQPIALVMDYVGIALSELGNISERRTERLVNPALSNGLPAFLMRQGGLHSGLMIAQYTAAALVSENKVLSHPASVDSIPTSANQEDHVSMGTIGCRKARSILDNVKKTLAIELLCAAQGLDLRCHKHVSAEEELPPACHETAGLEPGRGVKVAHDFVRSKIPHLGQDRNISIDIRQAELIIESDELLSLVEQTVGTLL